MTASSLTDGLNATIKVRGSRSDYHDLHDDLNTVSVLSDLSDHPSLKYKAGSPSTFGTSQSQYQHSQQQKQRQQQPQSNGGDRQSSAAITERKPKVSINEIASALSKKTSPSSQATNGFCMSTQQSALKAQLNGGGNTKTALSRILEDQSRAAAMEHKREQERREQERQQQEIQRIILAQAAACQPMCESFNSAIENDESNGSPDFDDAGVLDASSAALSAADVSGSPNGDGGADSSDGGLGPSDEQVRASMIHLLNPVLGSAFGSALIEEGGTTKRKSDEGGSGAGSKKHRWMTVDELEESRFGRSKSYGRVHCKATYKCALCGKPTTLNSTGSRWNLLRHVIMIHSDSKPYQCWDCDFIGIKSNVISHARQTNHRSDDAHDITTDTMRSEWNTMLHQCFPDYVKAKSRGWQASLDDTDADAIFVPNVDSPEIKTEV